MVVLQPYPTDSTELEIRNFVRDVHSRFLDGSDGSRPYEAIPRATEKLLTAVWRALTGLHEETNVTARINCLPNEVLARIFGALE